MKKSLKRQLEETFGASAELRDDGRLYIGGKLVAHCKGPCTFITDDSQVGQQLATLDDPRFEEEKCDVHIVTREELGSHLEKERREKSIESKHRDFLVVIITAFLFGAVFGMVVFSTYLDLKQGMIVPKATNSTPAKSK